MQMQKIEGLLSEYASRQQSVANILQGKLKLTE